MFNTIGRCLLGTLVGTPVLIDRVNKIGHTRNELASWPASVLSLSCSRSRRGDFGKFYNKMFVNKIAYCIIVLTSDNLKYICFI
jgi:hypothetical protein